MKVLSTLLLALWVLSTTAQQQYDAGYYDQDGYGQDSLYHDYAARQQEKEGQVAA